MRELVVVRHPALIPPVLYSRRPPANGVPPQADQAVYHEAAIQYMIAMNKGRGGMTNPGRLFIIIVAVAGQDAAAIRNAYQTKALMRLIIYAQFDWSAG